MHPSNKQRSKNNKDLSYEIKRWKRELRSMWYSWTPSRSSIIWKILGLSALMSAVNYYFQVPLTLNKTSLESNQWWVCISSGWVEAPSPPFFVILLLGVIAAMKSGALEGRVRKPRYFGYALGTFLALLFINILLPGMIWSLISEGLMLVWFGADFERRIGSKQFLLLSAITLSIAYTIGGLESYLFSCHEVSGLRPLTRGLIIAWGYLQAHAHLPLLNIRGAQLRWVVYAFCGFEILLYPQPMGFVSLAGALSIDFWTRRKLSIR